ncbi:MAG: heme exporter protein CcmB [Legionellales bacterium RIFCSPHIGHO2_12_FULL_42_9]|nr:MAG: heme exporter protein CcmB [Legionellales bacterium RIFCSPHIGHO2_12_FULL_42_9]
MSLMRIFVKQVRREWLLQVREPRSVLFSALFFAMVIVFFPLTISPNPVLLRQLAPGVFWIALLLALLMASERLFQEDFNDGVIEQWLVSGIPVCSLVLAKLAVHSVLNLLPILMLSIILAALFDLSLFERLVVMVSFILATPAILFLAALSAAFCTSMQQKGVLIALILLPLVIPVMIFGSGALNAAMQQLPVMGYFAILLALSILAIAFLPFAIAQIIRISLTD